MTDQVYSMGQNDDKECGHDEQKHVPNLVSILEGLEIVQIASGYQITIFLTSEGEVLEIGKWNNRSGKPFLEHEIPEPIVKIVVGDYSLYALSSSGNVFSWGNNSQSSSGFLEKRRMSHLLK